jgi:hypothetical protein
LRLTAFFHSSDLNLPLLVTVQGVQSHAARSW